jgi:hypothetical protein
VEAVWRYNGKEYAGGERGGARMLAGLPAPLLELCSFFQGRRDIEAMRVIAFPVRP